MGSKGTATPPPEPVQAPEIDYEALMMPMVGMMEMMNQQNTLDAQMALLSQAPESTLPEPIDWEAKNKELQSRISGEMTEAAQARRGRESTILTSALTDEDVTTTSSVLGGA